VIGVGASVLVDGEEFRLSNDVPFGFGRSDAEGVVGLDSSDMGISAVAGSVERVADLWWVVNRSRKRRLLLDAGGGGNPLPLESGQRFAVSSHRLVVLVPGAVFTHKIEVLVPEAELARVRPGQTSGTISTGDIRLSERDLDVLVALLGGYLEEFPRRNPRPRTYQDAADRLGPPWTKLTVRKQVERLKRRLSDRGIYLEGPQANYDLADLLIADGLLGPADTSRLGRRR
jgi:hypothetical protein